MSNVRLAAAVGVLIAVGSGIAAQTGTPQQPPPAPTGMISGAVVESGTTRPIAGAIISIYAAAGSLDKSVTFAGRRTQTGADGRFLFAGLPAARYMVLAQRSGFVTPSTSAEIRVADGQRVMRVELPLDRVASISGLITDEAGEPVVSAPILAIRMDPRKAGDAPTGAITKGGSTDDRGLYRIDGLDPGRYTVCVDQTNASVPTDALDAFLRQLNTFSSSGGSPLFDQIFQARASTSNPGTAGSMLVSNEAVTLGNALFPRVDAAGRLLVYPATYFPAAESIGKATVLALSAGEARSGVDIRMRPVAAHKVSGHLMHATGPAALTAITLAPLGAPADIGSSPGMIGTLTDASGAFEFPAVPQGEYRLRAAVVPRVETMTTLQNAVQTADGMTSMSMTFAESTGTKPPLPPDPTRWVDQPLSVGDTDITNLTLSTQEGAHVSGRVTVLAKGTPPAAKDLARANVQLRAVTGARLLVQPQLRVDETGAIASQGFAAGEYIGSATLSVPGGARWPLLSMMVNGIDVSQHPLAIATSDISDLVVTFTDQFPTLSGHVTTGTAAAANVSVFIFPEDEALPTSGELNRRRVQQLRTNPTGDFTASLPPGRYLVASTDDAARHRTLDVETLESMRSRAVSVSLALGDTKTIDLKTMTVR